MAWFERNFGFKETSYSETRSKFNVREINKEIILTSIPLGRDYFVGSFELPSNAELRTRLHQITTESTSSETNLLTFKNIGGNARSLHLDPANEGSVFQVASQFNCLEMVGPDVRPEDGITNYAHDKTQGPACAMACPAATVYRNYFVNGTGQGGHSDKNKNIKNSSTSGGSSGSSGKGTSHQLDGASDIAVLCNNEENHYWDMRNGYLIPTRHGAMGEIGHRIVKESGFHDELVSRLRVGVHWKTETESKKSTSGHHVCQVFSSACPVQYTNKTCRSSEWSTFATAILEGTFEATLSVGAIIAKKEQRRVKIFLTSVGAGAFGNLTIWVERALSRALTIFQNEPLDVYLVHFGTKPANTNNKFLVLEKKWRKKMNKIKALACGKKKDSEQKEQEEEKEERVQHGEVQSKFDEEKNQ